MKKQKAHGVGLALSVFMLAACSPALAQERPAVPALLTALEFAEPVPTSHELTSECYGGPFRMSWLFDGESSATTGLSMGNDRVGIDPAVIDNAMQAIGGDPIVRVACNRGGVEIRLIAPYAGNARPRQILLNIVDGAVREIHRYNFR